MARIPLRDIPNAPQPVAQAQGSFHQVNLGRAQTLLQQQTVDPAPFMAPARGLQSVAEGIGKFSGAAESWTKAALALQEQIDERDMWEAITALQEEENRVMAEIAANPTRPETYGPTMAKALESRYQQVLQKEGISDVAREKIRRAYDRMRVEAVGRVNLAGMRTLFDQNKKNIEQWVKRRIDEGRVDEAVDIINGYRGQLFFEEEADALVHHARQRGDELKVLQTMENDPDEAERLARDPKATPHLPELMRMKFSKQAETRRREIEVQNWETLANGVAEGTITSMEQAESIFGERFVKDNVRKIKNLFAQFPDMDAVNEKYAELYTKISQLDPMAPDAMDKKLDLRKEIISTMPEGFRKDLIDYLDARVNMKAEAQMKNLIVDVLENSLKAGVFGQWDDQKIKKGDKEELRKKNQAHAKFRQMMMEGEQWLKANPRAQDKDVNEWLERRMSREIRQAEPGWWRRTMPTWLGGAPKTTPPPPSDLKTRVGEKLNELDSTSKPALTPAPPGSKVTSYGYSNDPYKDSNSMKAIGAWNNRLEDGLSFAASPDVEAALKKQGIGKGDLVEVTLSNGETVVVRWDDRTMQDEQARKRFGKPLRGRWDFYSKNGLHPLDGVSVVGFRKAEV